MNKILFLMFIMGLFFGFSMSAFAEDNVIYGCYKKKNGKVRIVDGPDDCKKSEDSISWNMMGQGDDGKIGPTGPPGANGIDGDNGTNGNDGEVGPQGEKGDKGNDGYDGADILNELCELYKLTRYEFPEKCFNCGNGEVEPMEECDEGDENSDAPDDPVATCRTSCLEAGCGDLILDTGEECDDGNRDSADGCSNICDIEVMACYIDSYDGDIYMCRSDLCVRCYEVGQALPVSGDIAYICRAGATIGPLRYMTEGECAMLDTSDDMSVSWRY